ncbi:hypothetical protein GCM10011594_29030 [Nakamurella endophytica]|uniref:Uncharacterized protein n=1 Tax=Nakamurella endophytica TaxID=1748367 RepID=A0A917T1J1_9ACTN|nr:hypothetical protein GCM10011594_29030 [Nakamurella endophytica]
MRTGGHQRPPPGGPSGRAGCSRRRRPAAVGPDAGEGSEDLHGTAAAPPVSGPGDTADPDDERLPEDAAFADRLDVDPDRDDVKG